MSSKSTKKILASSDVSGESVKGEKAKEKVVTGAVGGCGGEESSDDQCVGVRQQLTKEKLDGFCRHLGDGRGECVILVLLLVFCCCCAGVNCCKICKGRCCTLVNDVVNVLVEHGEVDPDAEVTIIVFVYCYYCFVFVVEHPEGYY